MKLLATDFDRTFFNGDDYKKNIKSANKFVDEGNIFVIVTGRFLDHLLSDIKGLNLKYDYLICNDGGIIFDNKLNILYKKDIPKNDADDIVSLFKECTCLNPWYIDTGLTVTKDQNEPANGLIGRYINTEEAADLLKVIKERNKEIDGYLSDRWINIKEKTVNKGSSIKKLIDIVKVNESDVYTIGDAINDVSMSDYNFNNYSMEDSVIELKSKTIKSYKAVYELIEDILKDGLK